MYSCTFSSTASLSHPNQARAPRCCWLKATGIRTECLVVLLLVGGVVQAVTCDDFLAAMADANGEDLSGIGR